jgi:hypothetical protein
MKWKIGLLVLLGLLAIGMLIAGEIWLLELGFIVLLGWLKFLTNTLPKVDVSPAGVATGVACFVGAAALGHHFCAWLYSSKVQTSSEWSPDRRWRWQWTFKGLSLVVMMFAAGLCAAGVAHQVGWLLTSPEPLVEDSWAKRFKRPAVRLERIEQATNQLEQFDR